MRAQIIVLGAAACWCGLIVAAPAALSVPDGPVHAAGRVVYAFFSTVCHQWDSHSFHLFGVKLPVCIRCSAIYFSFLAGVVLSPLIGRTVERRMGVRTMVAWAAGGMIVDTMLSAAGVAESSTVTRLLTGGVFGMLIALVLTPLLDELVGSWKPSRAADEAVK